MMPGWAPASRQRTDAGQHHLSTVRVAREDREHIERCSLLEPTRIVRVSDASFRPGDDFCTMWHFLDLFPGGYGGWMPKFDYGNPDSRRVVPSCCAD